MIKTTLLGLMLSMPAYAETSTTPAVATSTVTYEDIVSIPLSISYRK